MSKIKPARIVAVVLVFLCTTGFGTSRADSGDGPVVKQNSYPRSFSSISSFYNHGMLITKSINRLALIGNRYDT